MRAIVDLGRHLGLDVVAEGVEDQPTWDLLTSMGCDPSRAGTSQGHAARRPGALARVPTPRPSADPTVGPPLVPAPSPTQA